MGHKIRPNSLRLGIIKDWNSRWFPKKFNFQRLLEEDVLIRAIIEKKIGTSGIDKIDIERMGNKYKVSVKVSRPGLAIGKGGKGIEDLIKAIESFLNKLRKKKSVAESFSLNVAQNIAWDFEKRMPFRRTIKKHIDAVMANKEIKGARIKVAGRLDGAEIARTEQLSRGRLPLQTLRANIDYGQATAYTTYGTIGIKVWAYKGDIFNK